ncbi:hypothetical protein QLG13_00630 [Rhodococcus aetherivorans]|uniref:hypothetical protein n=1 Tax=Rhodococcus aetherivorans TaxID=191292 RepID=UPI0012DF0916|nr:hypothetical protein [Rhodococcus aetherivorans]
MTAADAISDDQIDAKWSEISPLIERVMQRVGTADEFPIAAGSSISGDDQASRPYHVSHSVRSCLLAGVDHLHAVKSLIVDQGVLHTLAPFTLARGSLENLSLAYWILHPASRDERIQRALRWHAQNFIDQDKALAPLSLPNHVDKETKLQKVEATASARGINTNIRRGHSSTEAVTYADSNATTARNVLFAWRLCSGYAHGRQWALLGGSDREEHPTVDPDVVNIKLTASTRNTLFVTLESLHLLSDVLRTYDQRAGAHLSNLVVQV